MAIVIPLIALALIIAILAVVIWPMAKRPKPSEQAAPPQPRNATPEEIDGYALELRDRLDHTPFGEALPRRVWQKLMRTKADDGVIYERHRDFCGQGLSRTASGVKLCDVQDGGHSYGEPIAQWFSEEDFVAFLARQSDYSCSGWDDSEPTFFTTDGWYRNNQRLTRDVLGRFSASA